MGEARGALPAGVRRDRLGQIFEIGGRDAAGLLHQFRGVAGVVPLEDLEHAVRVLQRLITWRSGPVQRRPAFTESLALGGGAARFRTRGLAVLAVGVSPAG